MQFTLTPPGALEVEEVKNEDNELLVTPVLIKGSHVIRVAYCKATGTNGTESKAVMLFNANTGEFSIQRVDTEAAQFDFDKPVDEFQRRRTAARNTAKTKAAKSKAATDTSTKSET